MRSLPVLLFTLFAACVPGSKENAPPRRASSVTPAANAQNTADSGSVATPGDGPTGPGGWTDPGQLSTEGSFGTCGNGQLDKGEACDDGNNIPLDGCSNTCLRDGDKVQPAFPGAEGFGTKTRGGRGGKVYTVTTLNWSGPGSYSEAMAKEEPRIIVFAVSGVIQVPADAMDLNLGPKNSYVTVAGQTSPGGITFQGNTEGSTTIWSYPEGNMHTLNKQNTKHFHDAVFQHLRFRGRHNTDNVSMAAVHNIVFDHCDFSGADDETLDITFSHDITVQWSTLSNSGNPSGETARYGALISYYPTTNISMHHNLQANHFKRCGAHFHWEVEKVTPPGGAFLDFRNNIIHNCGTEAIYYSNYDHAGRTAYINVVGNTLSIGPGTYTESMGIVGVSQLGKVYLSDNKTINHMNNRNLSYPDYVPWTTNPVILNKETPMSPVTTEPRQAAYEAVLAKAGAWPRDEMNVSTVEEVKTGTGEFGNSASTLITSGPAAPTDSDGDGMPDDWEKEQGMDPSVDDSAGDKDGDGWTNIEEYLYARAQAIIGK